MRFLPKSVQQHILVLLRKVREGNQICTYIFFNILLFSCSVVSSSLRPPMDCSMPGFPVLHHLPEFAQTHVHHIGDAIQPSYYLSSPSPPACNISQQQDLFQWVSSSYQVAKAGASASTSVLPMNIQGWLPLGLTGLISLLSKGLSRVFSNTTVQKHQSFGIQLFYRLTLTSIHDYWKNHSFDYMDFCQ